MGRWTEVGSRLWWLLLSSSLRSAVCLYLTSEEIRVLTNIAVALVLRLIGRYMITRKFGIDDWLMIAGMVCSFGRSFRPNWLTLLRSSLLATSLKSATG